VNRLAADSNVQTLQADDRVVGTMAVTTASTGANQLWSGKNGGDQADKSGDPDSAAGGDDDEVGHITSWGAGHKIVMPAGAITSMSGTNCAELRNV
jgi:hypothetical protein